MNIVQLLMEKSSWEVKSVHARSTVRETAQLLLDFGVGALVVTNNENQMVGIVSERDLIQVIVDLDPGASETPIAELMTRSVISCGPNDEVAFVLHQMNEHAIRHMPVIEHDELVGILSIRELTKAYELLQIEANTDPLTQVSNRRSFLKTLDQEFERARRYGHPLCVAMIDLDHFKQVNDTFGHDAGDQVLRAFSALLISEFRTIDLVGRMGGEEFAVVFPETDQAGTWTACERFLQNARKIEVAVGKRTATVTASIGLATVTDNVLDVATALKRADELLYMAKHGGRDQIMAERSSASHAMPRGETEVQ